MKKKIGITDRFFLKENAHCLFEGSGNLAYSYVESIRMAGGLPCILPVAENIEEIKAQLEMVDGILFSGGCDINPLIFKEEPRWQLGEINEFRDYYELTLCKLAVEFNVPVLGICRGMQVINVALGGTLIQDISTQFQNSINHQQNAIGCVVAHSVKLEKSSLLYNEFKKEELLVNSFHHQAIAKLAKELKEVAFAKDGIIEAIEGKNKPVLAVQWHPELMTRKHQEMIKVFQWLVNF